MDEDKGKIEESKTKDKPKNKSSLIKKISKVVMYIILSIVGLNVLLYILLSIPAVQQKAKDFAVNELKNILKTEISIDELRLSLFNKISLKGIYIEDRSQDTLLFAKNLDASFNIWGLLDSELQITGINLDDFVGYVNQEDSISDFNFQFIVDAFASNDSTPSDTTKSSLRIIIRDITLSNGRLNYDVKSQPQTTSIFNTSHISVTGLNANIDLNSIDSDKFDIALNSLTAKDKSGLSISNLQGHFFSDKSRLWIDGLSLLLPNSHLKAKTAKYDLNSSEFELNTQDTEIAPTDLIPILPNLRFMSNNISLKTHIKGKLPFVDIENLTLTYGSDLIVDATASMSDVYKYGDSDISLFIEKFKVSPAGITELARVGDSTFILPDILRDAGDLQLKGDLIGKLSKFKVNMEAWSKQGVIVLKGAGGADTTFNNFNVNAELQTRNFGLGRLLGTDTGLGNLSMHTNITASQSDRVPLSAKLEGKINTLQYNGENIEQVFFNGFYNSQNMGISLNTDWTDGSILANAEMTQTKIPDIRFDLAVDSLLLDKFYKNEDWKNPMLSLRMKGNMTGLDIDNLKLTAELDSLQFKDSVFHFQPGLITLDAGEYLNGNKYIAMKSSILSFNIDGNYKLSTISDEFTDLMHTYMPSVFPIQKQIKNRENNFAFNIEAFNTEEIGKIFKLPLDVVKSSTLKGQVNLSDKIIALTGDFPLLKFGGTSIENTQLGIMNRDSSFSISGNARLLMEKGFYNTTLDIDGRNDNLKGLVKINSNETDIDINGQIETLAQFDRNEADSLISVLKIIPSDIKIENIVLQLIPAEILNVGNYTKIENFGIALDGKDYLNINGVVSNQESDTLNVYFNHAEVGDILKPLNINNIEACIHGNILLTNLLNRPELFTKNLEVADIVLFSDTLGTLSLESLWNDDIGGVMFDANLIHKGTPSAMIDGFIYPSDDRLDVSVLFNKLPLNWAQPFLSDLLYKTSGSISSGLSIEGSMSAPRTEGWFRFNDAEIGINYTNVAYNISDTIIEISPDKVGFEGLVIKDQYNNRATLKADVTHQNFKNMEYILDMNLNNLMLLNTEDRTDSLFYGKLFASGNVKVKGNDNGINMNLNIRNNKNSTLRVQLPQTAEASDYQSIVYINVPEEKKAQEIASLANTASKTEQPLNMNIDMTLNVNSGIALGVIINPSTGDNMQIRGDGQIKFGYNMLTEAMSTYGDYTLSDGSVRVNLQNISNLEFKIRQGSKLSFVGDPLKTKFNITAFRRVRASLSSLDDGFLTEESLSRVNVDCVLGITGDMDKMTLTYNIELPDASDDIKRRVSSLIATDEQKIKQFAYLVVSGAFYPSSGGGGNLGNSLWTNFASNTISGALNSAFGSMLGDKWEIGTNIESNDGSLNDMNMSVNVSRKFFDDRLKINTNLGYQSNETMDDNAAIIGDFEVEYQLSPTWTIKAYNHANDKYYRQASTTQGIGLVYTREARTLKRLFNFFSSGRRRRSNEEQTPPSNTTEKQPAINEEKK